MAPFPFEPVPRVLHVAETARGGVGTYLAELLPEQARAFGAENVLALVPTRDVSHIAGVDRRLLTRWPRRGRSLVSLIRLGIEIERQLRRFKPTVVHAHSSFAGLLVRLLIGARRHRPAIIYCPHGWGFDRTSRPLSNSIVTRIERTLSKWCDRIVVISEHERRSGLGAGIAYERMALIHNGIADHPLPPASRWEDDRLKLLFVGRLDQQKGIDTLLDAVATLERRVTLRVIGSSVVGAGALPRIAPNVEYLGWRSLAEVEAEIVAADVVVVPSRWEGFGLVALEAMRGGRAVLASRVGGLPEIVADGVTGRLVAPDSPVELIRALTGTPRGLWKAMGEAGRRHFQELFTADRMARRLTRLYEEVTSEHLSPSVVLGPAELTREPLPVGGDG